MLQYAGSDVKSEGDHVTWSDETKILGLSLDPITDKLRYKVVSKGISAKH